MGETPDREGPGTEPLPLGPHPHPQKSAKLTMSCSCRKWPEFPEGHVGAKHVCPTGPGSISPGPPKEEFVTQGPMGEDVWCLGWSAQGHPRVWKAPAVKEWMEGY